MTAPVPSSQTAVSQISIGQYLIKRLIDYGVRDLFGIPGDYVLSFYSDLEESPINTVGCTREDCAGFDADAYARVNGIGAVCVTYCVGGLSLCNSIAGAYAEKSPVVVISGSPGLQERHNNPLLHHRVRDFRTQSDVFRRICTAHAELGDPAVALREIDRVLDAVVRFRRPGYIELPRDVVNLVVPGVHTPVTCEPVSNPDALDEATAEASRRIAASSRPVIVAGVEFDAEFPVEMIPLLFVIPGWRCRTGKQRNRIGINGRLNHNVRLKTVCNSLVGRESAAGHQASAI